MVSRKFQMLDIGTKLQVSVIEHSFKLKHPSAVILPLTKSIFEDHVPKDLLQDFGMNVRGNGNRTVFMETGV